jgi:hypothetical protein
MTDDPQKPQPITESQALTALGILASFWPGGFPDETVSAWAGKLVEDRHDFRDVVVATKRIPGERRRCHYHDLEMAILVAKKERWAATERKGPERQLTEGRPMTSEESVRALKCAKVLMAEVRHRTAAGDGPVPDGRWEQLKGLSDEELDDLVARADRRIGELNGPPPPKEGPARQTTRPVDEVVTGLLSGKVPAASESKTLNPDAGLGEEDDDDWTF